MFVVSWEETTFVPQGTLTELRQTGAPSFVIMVTYLEVVSKDLFSVFLVCRGEVSFEYSVYLRFCTVCKKIFVTSCTDSNPPYFLLTFSPVEPLLHFPSAPLLKLLLVEISVLTQGPRVGLKVVYHHLPFGPYV